MLNPAAGLVTVGDGPDRCKGVCCHRPAARYRRRRDAAALRGQDERNPLDRTQRHRLRPAADQAPAPNHSKETTP